MSRYELTIGGVAYSVDVLSVSGNLATVNVNGLQHQVQIGGPPIGSPAQGPAPAAVPLAPAPQPVPAAAAAPAPGPSVVPCAGELVVAPMPGHIISVAVKEGDRINNGDTVVVMEAMKMENEIRAHVSGTVVRVSVSKGQSVKVGDALVMISG